MESEKSQGSVLKAIMHAKEANVIDGIHGRMGDLGAIDAAAQACVELLRSKSLGVATFMILEKQVHYSPKIKEKVRTPEGVPRLFDLVKVQDERMKLAFFAALGNTVVAEDIEQDCHNCTSNSDNKHYRALFEKSGTMSGGGGKPRGGKMGTSIRAASVSAEAISDAEKELSRIAENLDNLKSQCDDLKRQLDSLRIASEPSKEEVNRLKELKKTISAEEKWTGLPTRFKTAERRLQNFRIK
ncbi:Structural maintenance of chromosomes protein 4 [Datura stramonium]|uniref:Structural maintenance of chromosomes protein 4 n=1 Tax=Datura stramonium TaxID=4076 RepID=A0ABS8VAN2_DATST|nr:Structural maintenance of chromosomes protein 4 [Datura stramonium]